MENNLNNKLTEKIINYDHRMSKFFKEELSVYQRNKDIFLKALNKINTEVVSLPENTKLKVSNSGATIFLTKKSKNIANVSDFIQDIYTQKLKIIALNDKNKILKLIRIDELLENEKVGKIHIHKVFEYSVSEITLNLTSQKTSKFLKISEQEYSSSKDEYEKAINKILNTLFNSKVKLCARFSKSGSMLFLDIKNNDTSTTFNASDWFRDIYLYRKEINSKSIHELINSENWKNINSISKIKHMFRFEFLDLSNEKIELEDIKNLNLSVILDMDTILYKDEAESILNALAIIINTRVKTGTVKSLHLSNSKRNLYLKISDDNGDTHTFNINDWVIEIHKKKHLILENKSECFSLNTINKENKIKDFIVFEDPELINEYTEFFNKNESLILKILNEKQNKYKTKKVKFINAFKKTIDSIFNENIKISLSKSSSGKSVMLKLFNKKSCTSVNINTWLIDIYEYTDLIFKEKQPNIALNSILKDFNLIESTLKKEFITTIKESEILALEFSKKYLLELYSKDSEKFIKIIDQVELLNKNISSLFVNQEDIYINDKSNFNELCKIKDKLKTFNFTIEDIEFNIYKNKEPLNYILRIGDLELYNIQLKYINGEIKINQTTNKLDTYINNANTLKHNYEYIYPILNTVIRFKSKYKALLDTYFNSYSDDFIKIAFHTISSVYSIFKLCDHKKITIIIETSKTELQILNASLEIFNKSININQEDIEYAIEEMYIHIQEIFNIMDWSLLKKTLSEVINENYKALEKFLTSSINIYNNLTDNDIIEKEKDFYRKPFIENINLDMYLQWIERLNPFYIPGLLYDNQSMHYSNNYLSRFTSIIYKENNIYHKSLFGVELLLIEDFILSGIIITDESNKLSLNTNLISEIERYIGEKRTAISSVNLEELTQDVLLEILNKSEFTITEWNISKIDISYELLHRNEFNDKLVITFIELINKLENPLMYIPEYINLFKHMDDKFIKLLQLKSKQTNNIYFKIFLHETLYLGLNNEYFKDIIDMSDKKHISYFTNKLKQEELKYNEFLGIMSIFEYY